MENTIDELLASYEDGTFTRQFIAALALLAGACTRIAAVPLPGATLDHVSLQVSDVERSTMFYRVFM